MALAIGVIVGSLTLSIWGGFKRKIVSVNVAQILCGLILSFIAIVPENKFYLVLVATLLTGVTSSYINSPVTAIFQAKVEKAMQGRVMSIVTVVCMVSMPLSLAIAGPLSEVVGLMPIVYVPGLISTIVGIACFLIPPLMKIEDHPVTDAQEPLLVQEAAFPAIEQE
jgi:DHA3 family macrolide efflux protein-like MFS transporter